MSLSRRIASKLRDAVAGSCRAGLLADLGGGSRRRLLQTATPEATTGPQLLRHWKFAILEI